MDPKFRSSAHQQFGRLQRGSRHPLYKTNMTGVALAVQRAHHPLLLLRLTMLRRWSACLLTRLRFFAVHHEPLLRAVASVMPQLLMYSTA